MKEKKDSLDTINHSLLKLIDDFLRNEFKLELNDTHKIDLLKEITSIQKEDLSNIFPQSGAFIDHQLFDEEIRKMIHA